MKESSAAILCLVVGLLCLAVWGLFAYFSYRRLKKRNQEQQMHQKEQKLAQEAQRRAREGLRRRIFNDKEVSITEWRSEWNHPNRDASLLGYSILGSSPGSVMWLDGEQHGLLPGDIVLKWDFTPHPVMSRWGYAIERNGRIVAEVLIGMS